MLTGKEIADLGILQGFEEGNVQQQGIDVRVAKIRRLNGWGCLPKEGKTQLPEYEEYRGFENGNPIYLTPGYYEIELMEGCKVPPNVAIKPITRSSLVRMGGNVYSGLFDAGFETDHMGCFLQVSHSFKIEYGARVAQVIAFESNQVSNLYNGQFQNDQQREQK
jgi:deoxycytidine triphosphate deaminase